MRDRLRNAYARLRGWPWVGVVASRAVWAAKGALGRPIIVTASGSLAPARPTQRRLTPPPPSDARMLVAMAAIQGLIDRGELANRESLSTQREIAPARRANMVSVVVSTLDRASWLDRALTALAYQRHGDFEVIVVAGPSTDDTDAVLARHRPRIRVVRCPEANLAVARNLGVLAAEGEIVAFLDDDAAPEPDWLQHLAAPYVDAAVGGVGGPTRDHTGVAFQCRTVVADRFGRSEQVENASRARLDPPGPEVERYLSLTGASSSFRRRALMQVGGFDEAYSYFLDETDVCLRLAEAGWKLELAPDAEVHHAYAPSAQRRADHAPLTLLAPARSTAYFAARNAGPRHGIAAVAERLQDYADALRADIAWRVDHGVGDANEARRLEADVARGLSDGVRAALAGPRRLLPAGRPVVTRRPPTSVLRAAGDRLKLCLLSQEYPGAGAALSPPGGIAVWTEALASALARRGHEVSVVTRASDPVSTAAFVVQDAAGVWVHRVAGRRGAASRAGLLAGAPASVAEPAAAAAAEVARIAPRRSFDLVMGPLWDLEAAAVCGSQWPTAVSLHTACAQMAPFKPDWTEDYRRNHVARVIAGERRLLQAAPHVLANSQAVACDIGAALDLPDLALRATVIPHGLPDLAVGVEPAGREDGVEILFVGRLERRKGVDVLLAAAPALMALAADVRLTLVGADVAGEGEPGVRQAFLAAYAGAPWLSRVRFAGPLPRAELLAHYAGSDVVVVPSRYESFGLTALEAMIFGKPCVASSVGGLSEVVEDGVTGRLVLADDPAALAGALLMLVRSEPLRSSLGEAGRRRYERLFTADAMATAYEGWVRDIVGRSGRLAAE
jgi:glycogen synthase